MQTSPSRGYVSGILFGLYLKTLEECYRLVTRLSGRPGPVHSRGVQGLDILLSDGGRRPLISAADESLLYLLVTRSLQELRSPVWDKDFTVFSCYYSRKITMHWMWKCGISERCISGKFGQKTSQEIEHTKCYEGVLVYFGLFYTKS